jgi:uncharacterized protein (TIGR02118 family)
VIKIVWLLKKADHLSTQEFHDWWLNSHAPHARKAPGLRKYVINFAREKDDLAGKPTWDCQWDGVAEQWFDDEDALNRAYSRPVSGEIRQDTLAHVARLERVIVREIEIAPEP